MLEIEADIDNEGYLIESVDWREALANSLAGKEELILSGEHWEVIKFIRNYYDEHLTAPDSRFVVKFLANELDYGKDAKKQLFKLFPYGYVKQACKIAGMKRPRSWSTG